MLYSLLPMVKVQVSTSVAGSAVAGFYRFTPKSSDPVLSVSLKQALTMFADAINAGTVKPPRNDNSFWATFKNFLKERKLYSKNMDTRQEGAEYCRVPGGAPTFQKAIVDTTDVKVYQPGSSEFGPTDAMMIGNVSDPSFPCLLVDEAEVRRLVPSFKYFFVDEVIARPLFKGYKKPFFGSFDPSREFFLPSKPDTQLFSYAIQDIGILCALQGGKLPLSSVIHLKDSSKSIDLDATTDNVHGSNASNDVSTKSQEGSESVKKDISSVSPDDVSYVTFTGNTRETCYLMYLISFFVPVKDASGRLMSGGDFSDIMTDNVKKDSIQNVALDFCPGTAVGGLRKTMITSKNKAKILVISLCLLLAVAIYISTFTELGASMLSKLFESLPGWLQPYCRFLVTLNTKSYLKAKVAQGSDMVLVSVEDMLHVSTKSIIDVYDSNLNLVQVPFESLKPKNEGYCVSILFNGKRYYIYTCAVAADDSHKINWFGENIEGDTIAFITYR